MFPVDRQTRQPLGRGRPHVVRAEDLHDGGPRCPRQERHVAHPQREGGQHQVGEAPIPVPRGGEELELHGHQEHEEEAKPELGQRDAGHRPDHRAGVQPRAVSQRREEPQRHPHPDGDRHGHQGQFQCGPEPRQEHLPDILAPQERETQVAARQVLDVVPVPDMERLVQVPFLQHLLDVFRIHPPVLHPGGHQGGVARQHVQQEEHDQRDHQDRRHELQHTSERVREHHESTLSPRPARSEQTTRAAAISQQGSAFGHQPEHTRRDFSGSIGLCLFRADGGRLKLREQQSPIPSPSEAVRDTGSQQCATSLTPQTRLGNSLLLLGPRGRRRRSRDPPGPGTSVRWQPA